MCVERSTLPDAEDPSEALLAAAAQQSCSPLLGAERGGSVCYANEAASLLLAQTREELLGQSLAAIDPSLDPEPWFQESAPAFPACISALIQRQTGSPLEVELSFSRVFHQDREYVFVRITDTSLRPARTGTLLSHRLLDRKRSGSDKTVTWILDLDTRQLTYVSPSVVELRGFTAPEVMAGTLEEIFPEHERRRVRTILDKIISDIQRGRFGVDQFLTFEVPQLHKNGSLIQTELIMSFHQDTATGHAVLQGISRDITARREAEFALQASEARYRNLFEAMRDAYAMVDMEGRFIEHNQAFRDLIGFTSAELDQLAYQDLTPVRWHEQEAKTIQEQVLTRGYSDIYEKEYRHKDGHCVPVELHVFLLRDPQGKPAAQWAIIRDLSERQRAEAALRESEARFRSLYDNTTDVMFWIRVEQDGSFTVEDINPAEEHYLGIAKQDVIGKPLQAILPPQAASHVIARYQACVQSKQPTSYEETLEFADRRLTAQTLLLPLTDSTGQVRTIVGTSRDITERVSHEERLKQSEDRFQALLNHTLDTLFWIKVVSPDVFLLEGMNPTGRRRMGPNAHLPEGLPVGAYYPPELADSFEAHLRACMQAGSPITFEETIPDPPDTIHQITTLVPVRDDGGNIYRIVGNARDVTRSRQLEEALRQTQKLESLGVLAGGIAHDFNNLLTAMMGNLNLAQLKLAGSSPAQPHLEAVEAIMLKASELTRQMLAYSGRGHFVVKPQNLNAIIREMLHLLRVTISKNARLITHLDDALPSLEGDAAQLQQVVMNLVTNASEALEDQEGTIQIRTWPVELDQDQIEHAFPAQELVPGPFVALEVQDTGCGMGREVLTRIFDPFFTTKLQGRGLGLSAMLGILKAHGAGIRIQSERHVGTTFQIYFPASSKPALLPAPQTGEINPDFSGTVLLVDDEDLILQATGGLLESLGFTVIQARDGREALERFQEEAPRLTAVLMDLTMPRLDGASAFRAMRALSQDVPIILSSGYSQPADSQFEGTAPDAFVQKPYQIRELRKTFWKLLHQS